MSHADKFITAIRESKAFQESKRKVIKYTTTKEERALDPGELAKKKFNVACGSFVELATMGGHIYAQIIRARTDKNKKDEKYYQEVLDKFDQLYKRKEKEEDEAWSKSR